MRAPRVVLYNPYSAWLLHGFTTATIANALKVRGAEVTYVSCDALYTDCSLYRESLGPRPADACLACQGTVIGLARQLGFELTWLGRYLHIEEQNQARAWADALSPEELVHATYGHWPINDWLSYSIHCHIRDAYPEVNDPHVIAVRRSFAYSGLLACMALDRLLAMTDPDVFVVFYGFLASTRLAVEIAHARGVRVVTHYRAPRSEELLLTENDVCHSNSTFDEYWNAWSEVPLSAVENEELNKYLFASETGSDPGVISLQTASHDATQVAAKLGLRADRRTWMLSMSSGEDDHARDPNTPFSSQIEWIKATVEYVRAHPEVDLVIRAHPNIGSKRSPGQNRRQLAELAELKAGLPANATVVDSFSDLNTYGLMDCATAAIVWGSLTGLEMAVRGKPVVSVAACQLRDRPYTLSSRSVDSYVSVLDRLLEFRPGTVDPEIARAARRQAYGIFCRMHVPFPLIRATGFNEGDLLYQDFGSLTPTQTESLDRIWRILIGGEPACPPPGPQELARTEQAEDEELARLFGQKVTVLSYADEILEDSSLLPAWSKALRGRPDMRLVIETADDRLSELVDVVGRAGLLEDPDAELVAGHFAAALTGVDLRAEQVVRPVAVLTRRVDLPEREFAHLPRLLDLPKSPG